MGRRIYHSLLSFHPLTSVVSSIFLHTYIKWESGSSKTKSAGSTPVSEMGTGSKCEFDELPPGFSKPGLAEKVWEKGKNKF